MKTNKAVVFESLSEQEFRNIFSPGKEYPDYTIEQMKMARLANKSIYDKVQASNKQRLNNTEVKAILDITLTRGNFNTVDPLEDLTPLNKLPIHKINGVPVIVDLVLFNGTASILPMMGLSSMNENGEIVFPELYEKTVKKLSQIARNNVSNPLNSKYWALVEDKVGQVEHEGKKYTWVPITSNQLSTERKDIVFNRLKEIRNKLISNQFKTEQEYKDEITALNNMFFLSMHDTSGYTSDQKTFLSVSKGSDKFPAGNVALKIEYKITGQKGEAWFNFDISKVNSFDEMIAEVEKIRTHSKVKAHQDLSGLQPLTPRSIRENLGKFDKINPNERDIMNEFGAMVRENYLINQSILFNGKTYNPSISKSKEETKENVADLIEEDDDDEESVSTISPKNINDEPSNLPAQNKANTLVISNTRGKVDLNQKPNDTVLNRVNVSIKQGVQELFEQSPELANEVYEALGFKTESSSNTITRDIKEELPFKVIGNYNEIEEGLIGRKFYEEKIGNDLYRFEISNYSYPNEDGSSESFYDIDFTVNGSEEVIGTGFFDKAERAKQILQALLSQNFGNDTVRFNVEESKKGKQRLSLYKRLMNQLGYNPSGEMEYALFYNTNTFLSPSDKIIFGHPTIGKSFLKNQLDKNTKVESLKSIMTLCLIFMIN